MDKRIVVGLGIAVAIAGILYLGGGLAWLAPGDGRGGASDDGAPDLLGAGGQGGPGAGKAERADGLVLFGRSRAERVGRGGLEGRVVDFDTGAPIAQATVTIAGRGYADEDVALQATTDADGAFRLADVPAGDAFVLHVQDPQKRQRTLGSQSVDADRILDVGTIWIGQNGVLRGVVTDGAGTPLADADVQVHPGVASMLEIFRDMARMLEQLDKDSEPIARGRTDAKGVFAIPGVPPGPLTLLVRRPGFQQAVEKIVMTSDGAAGGDVKVRLVEADAVEGIVVDERGRGIAGARVACLEKNQMEGVFYGRQFTLTDGEGRFRVESPPSRGGFAVIVTAVGYPKLLTEGKVGQSQRFVLVGGADVVLRVLEDGTRRPVEGAQLTAMFSDEMGEMNNNVNLVTGLTDARGEARVLARPGTLGMLYLQHPERGTAIFAAFGGVGPTSTLQGPEDTKVKRPKTTLEFLLRTGVDVRGRVTDADGAPIEDARVAVLGGMGLGGQARTDADGAYHVRGQSAPITMVLVSKSGWVQPVTAMRITATEAPADGLVHDVVLERAASVIGRVVDPEGRPVAGARVKPESVAGMAFVDLISGLKPAITNEDGRYVLGDVKAGEAVRVMARVPGYLDSRTEPFAVAAGRPTQAPDLALRRGSWIDVRVESPSGVAVEGARVEVDVDAEQSVEFDPMAGLTGFADLATRRDGTVRVVDVPDGEATVTASRKGHAPGRAAVTVKRETADGRHEVTVRLRPAVTLKGRVLDADDKPVEGASVSTAQPDQAAAEEGAWMPFRTATTDAQGRFEIPDLPDVTFLLHVEAEGYRTSDVPAATGRGEVEVRVEAVDPATAARLEEIDAELARIYQAFGEAKDEAQRNAILKRMQALQAQKKRLEGE